MCRSAICGTNAGPKCIWGFWQMSIFAVNMKTKSISFAAVLLLLLAILSGCNPNHPTPGAPSSYKVKTIITTSPGASGNDTTTFTYDAIGRVVKVQPTINGGYEATYRFFADSMDIVAYNNGINSARGRLNTSGTLASTVNYCPGCGNYRPENYHILYTYDNAGFMVDMTEVTYNTPSNSYHFQWIDSCLMSVSADTASFSVTNTYYANTREYRDNGQENMWGPMNVWNSGLGQFYLFGSVCGGHSKLLLKSSTYANGFVFNYSYTFDQYGRVATQTTTSNNGTTVQQYTYY